MPELQGARLQKALLSYGRGMKRKPKGLKKKSTKPKGLRLRKTVRGNEISLDTVQINTKVLKEGSKKFDSLIPKKEAEKPAEAAEHKPEEK